MPEETVLDQVVEANSTEASPNAPEASHEVEDVSILGDELDAEGNHVAKPKAEASKPKVETAEEKAAREAQEAENKRLLEADEKSLTPEELAKKKELIKAQETAKAKSVPEKYEVKVEGYEVDQTMLEKLSPVFKELKLTQEAVQKIANVYAPLVQAQVEKQQQDSINHFKEITNGWKEETNKLLGAEPAKELRFAAKFLNKFGSPELREMMKETGVGNHPELVKALIKAGKAISEDAFVDPSKQSSGVGGLEIIYDHPTSKQTLK